MPTCQLEQLTQDPLVSFPASLPAWWWEWDRDLTSSIPTLGSGFEAIDVWVWLACARLVIRQGSAIFPLSWLAAERSGFLQPAHRSWPWAALIRVRYSLAWGNVFFSLCLPRYRLHRAARGETETWEGRVSLVFFCASSNFGEVVSAFQV